MKWGVVWSLHTLLPDKKVMYGEDSHYDVVKCPVPHPIEFCLEIMNLGLQLLYSLFSSDMFLGSLETKTPNMLKLVYALQYRIKNVSATKYNKIQHKNGIQ